MFWCLWNGTKRRIWWWEEPFLFGSKSNRHLWQLELSLRQKWCVCDVRSIHKNPRFYRYRTKIMPALRVWCDVSPWKSHHIKLIKRKNSINKDTAIAETQLYRFYPSWFKAEASSPSKVRTVCVLLESPDCHVQSLWLVETQSRYKRPVIMCIEDSRAQSISS